MLENRAMILSVHQPQYIPWLGFFDKLARSDAFVFLNQVQYKPREWQNRNKIRTKDGSLWLTVPVIHTGERQAICDARIDNTTNWAKDHWKSLCTWYAGAEYFEQYKLFFESVYQKEWEFLSDLNIYIIQFVLKELHINTPVYLESDIGTSKRSSERIIEIAQKLGADMYLTGIGGKNYLDEEKFVETKIALAYQEFEHPVYQQQYIDHDHPFLPGMSILDLLFNEGENSQQILSTVKETDHV